MNISVIFNIPKYDININGIIYTDNIIKIPANLPRYNSGDKIDFTDDICGININGGIKIKYIDKYINIITKTGWKLTGYNIINNTITLHLIPPQFIVIHPGNANRYTYIKLCADVFTIDYDNITCHGKYVCVPIFGVCSISTIPFDDKSLIYCSSDIFEGYNYKYISWKDNSYKIDTIHCDLDYIPWYIAKQYDETLADIKNKYGYVEKLIAGQFIIKHKYSINYISVCPLIGVICLGFNK